MISWQETLDLSREFGLDPNVVEKDYVLGWLLAGIFNHPALRSSWVFKGGTCLKKCYFETYRFSEDPDFTVTDASHLKRDFLVPVFTEVGQWVYENSGIEFPANTQRFDVYENPRGQVSVQGRVGYRGPMQRGGDPARVIRFAAANRLCVDLRYQGSSRVIEPYSLRRTKDGALLLFAVKHQTGELRSYRMDRIEGAAATRVSFVPRFLVELIPAGGIHVPPTARRAK